MEGNIQNIGRTWRKPFGRIEDLIGGRKGQLVLLRRLTVFFAKQADEIADV